MDYLQDAFGGLNPQFVKDAAAKLALNAILMDERFDELARLLVDGHEIGAMEGEPGWQIERRDTGLNGELRYYAVWPIPAGFRVRVDPRAFGLAFQEVFMESHEFQSYVGKAIDAYRAANCSAAKPLTPLIGIAKKLPL